MEKKIWWILQVTRRGQNAIVLVTAKIRDGDLAKFRGCLISPRLITTAMKDWGCDDIAATMLSRKALKKARRNGVWVAGSERRPEDWEWSKMWPDLRAALSPDGGPR